MRIVAGQYRGRSLEAPQGEGTRPTIDRVREALFSSLYSLRGGFEDAVVLDAFAGSGALGIEALSRGASRVLFCDRDANALRVIERNVQTLGIDRARATCLKRDVMKNPPVDEGGPFDLVFLDPPYAFDPAEVVGFVEALCSQGAVSADAIVVYEHAYNVRKEAAEAVEGAGFEVVASKKYGKTGVTIWELREPEADSASATEGE